MSFVLLLASCTFPVEQPEVCARYIACIAARDARDGTNTDVVRFSKEGDCWGTPRGGTLCETACKSGLAFLAEKDPLPECVP
jgi:hypothetical protein